MRHRPMKRRPRRCLSRCGRLRGVCVSRAHSIMLLMSTIFRRMLTLNKWCCLSSRNISHRLMLTVCRRCSSWIRPMCRIVLFRCRALAFRARWHCLCLLIGIRCATRCTALPSSIIRKHFPTRCISITGAFMAYRRLRRAPCSPPMRALPSRW